MIYPSFGEKGFTSFNFSASSKVFPETFTINLSFLKNAPAFPFYILMAFAPNIFPATASGISNKILLKCSSAVIFAKIYHI